jgi:hypothetical protein
MKQLIERIETARLQFNTFLGQGLSEELAIEDGLWGERAP